MKIWFVLALVLGLSSCGFQKLQVKQLPFSEVVIIANHPQLERQARALLKLQLNGEGAAVVLRLEETETQEIISYGTSGEADQIKLFYTLDYRLSDQSGGDLHASNFRYTQTLDNDETILHASNLSHRRIYDLSRQRGLTQLMRELSFQIEIGKIIQQ